MVHSAYKFCGFVTRNLESVDDVSSVSLTTIEPDSRVCILFEHNFLVFDGHCCSGA